MIEDIKASQTQLSNIKASISVDIINILKLIEKHLCHNNE